MNRAVWIGLSVWLIAMLGVLGYFKYDDWIRPLLEHESITAADNRSPAPIAELPKPPSHQEPIRYQVPTPKVVAASSTDDAVTQAPPEPMPTLAESDAPLREDLTALTSPRVVDSVLVPQRLIERVVVTLNSMDAEPVPLRLRGAKPVAGRFLVSATGPKTFELSPDNAQRYQGAVNAFRQIDDDTLANLYIRYYPLFQEAYDGLGSGRGNGYFNDRLIHVLDHLIATPIPDGPIKLIKPEANYQFADPDLEALSSGQKLLIRMGTQNARAVKAKLQTLRAALLRKIENPSN